MDGHKEILEHFVSSRFLEYIEDLCVEKSRDGYDLRSHQTELVGG